MTPQEIQAWNVELAQEALEVLSKKGIKGICPACRSNDLVAEVGAFSMATFNYAQTSVRKRMPSYAILYPLPAPPGLPALALTCMNCGHTQVFNLRVLGIVREEAPPQLPGMMNLPGHPPYGIPRP
jgi:hypothetical protein